MVKKRNFWHILWVNDVMCRSSCWLVGSRGGDVWNGGGKIALLQQVTVHINLNDNDRFFQIIPGTMIFCLSLFLWRKWGSPRPYLVKPRTYSVVSSSRILSGGWEAAPRTLREWKHSVQWLMSFMRIDSRAVKAHSFFHSINWADLEKKRITPPFKPQVVNDTDTRWDHCFCQTSPHIWLCISRYFDSEFTGESVELTPPDHKGGHLVQIPEGEEEGDDEYFTQFSYQGASVLGGTSLLSVNSHWHSGPVLSDQGLLPLVIIATLVQEWVMFLLSPILPMVNLFYLAIILKWWIL